MSGKASAFLLVLCSSIIVSNQLDSPAQECSSHHNDLETQLEQFKLEMTRAQAQMMQQIQAQSEQLSRQSEQILEQREEIRELKERVDNYTQYGGKVGGSTAETHRLEDRQEYNRSVRSDDTEAWQPVVSQMSSQLTDITAQLQALSNKETLLEHATGSSFVRWGNTACPDSTELVYSGTVGGSHGLHTGSAANTLCLPPDPTFDNHALSTEASSMAKLYGGEYQTQPEATYQLTPVCAVCRTPRATVIMVAAKMTCPVGWTKEYGGHLMAGSDSHEAATEFICVDSHTDYVPGTSSNDNGRLLYYTVTRCGSLPCPPYVNNKIVSCVVCSK